MLRTVLLGKIHRATVTGACLEYVGSISVDSRLLAAAGILPHEQVHVVNLNNGARLVTYAIEASEGSGAVVLNGAAARLAAAGDQVIVLAYGQGTAVELEHHQPQVVYVDAQNRIVSVHRSVEHAG
ncbi:aspartate 1-decarboxylase [Gloeobacter violaceus]|uniref:Aspartate 1-decarboxylase 2 n=1 Tax=Gloeobacter violaceus (strain ATCC 29082 / PCC 7421) TaxID=251221 RepID=PAND2_GLOVI|nr:aspartate 1-decarboxylase [Gloeobacter violaceus]Q7NDK7.1 RecName: Full=Aspartate 1-decarboxylase 2; AltName: Full=Aspartate alpha-decarboxylase 2; Contains: RecName: Full=Aspartate 1-decarboxylase beta chain; Contains: RecName: Full=Aspartate 1-decarboxylase alpha chain; Flags: Precursor [Gloeobacter violaceus PCC 7421]BAC92169.1 aspartate 1-decarboxylase [Gloeobacter violaceus PCC 7421]